MNGQKKYYQAGDQYIIGNHHDAPNDFREMCDCDHLIMPNSSFSWWPAR